MSEETIVAPAAETQNTAAELTQTPEVVTEQTEQTPEPQVSEKDERDKAIARMERRINRKHAEAAEARAENAYLKEQLQRFEASKPEERVEVDPKQFERAVSERAREIAKAARFDEQCNTIAAKGAKEFSDFDQAVTAVASELPLFERNGYPTAAMQVVLEAENPSALLHYLGKNPDIASELADLTPIQMTRRLDRIEREMAANPKTSSAPKPLTPVKATASDSGLSSAKSDEEWARMRDKEIRARSS